MSSAQAYEADIHYSTTYVLARAVGWPEADALTIASANQALDENPDTVAALEVDATPGHSSAGYLTSSLRQAQKNLTFHCFGRTRERGARVSSDVLEVVSAHFSGIPDHAADPRAHARRLIALGVALHCQQDAHSHAGFGGSCGEFSGSCHGHTYQTLLDEVVFRLVRRHYFNPDHPGVSGERLLEVLEGTASALAARRPRAHSRRIPAKDLAALADSLRRSGLELPDQVRRDCNRHLAGKWLFDFFQSGSGMLAPAGPIQRLAPDVAAACGNPALASASIVRLPEPRYPRLNADASPAIVRSDGTYQLIRVGELDVSLPHIHASSYPARKVKVQLSHWRQLLTFPLSVRIALLPEDSNRKVR